MRTTLDTDIDYGRRIFKEAETIWNFVGDLVNEDENLPSEELQDMMYEFLDNMIQFRCALESAVYEGLDHFDQEA